MKRMTEEQHDDMMGGIAFAAGISLLAGLMMQINGGSWAGFLTDAAKAFALLASCIVGWMVLFVLTKPEAPDETK